MRYFLHIVSVFLIAPNLLFAATDFKQGLFWNLFFIKTKIFQQQKPKPKPELPENRSAPPNNIRPLSHPIEVSREDLKKEIDKQINGYTDEKGRHIEGIKEQITNIKKGIEEARGENSIGYLNKLIKNLADLKDQIERQLSLLNQLQDQLNDPMSSPESIKRSFAVIRVSVYGMIIRRNDVLMSVDWKPRVDKKGEFIRVNEDAPIIRTRMEMAEIIKGSQVTDTERNKLRGKIINIDISLKNLSDQLNQISDMMHSKSQITN